MRSASSTACWLFAIKILVTVYLSTSYLSGCQLLCNARANNRHSHQLSSNTSSTFTQEFSLYCFFCAYFDQILGRIPLILPRSQRSPCPAAGRVRIRRFTSLALRQAVASRLAADRQRSKTVSVCVAAVGRAPDR